MISVKGRKSTRKPCNINVLYSTELNHTAPLKLSDLVKISNILKHKIRRGKGGGRTKSYAFVFEIGYILEQKS